MTALRPILIVTVHDDGRSLNPGDLVTYHGRNRWRHGDLHYVSDVFEDMYLILDRDYPSVDPLHVRRNAIRPTGQTVVLCDCGHEQGRQRSGSVDMCDAHPACSCLQHPPRD